MSACYILKILNGLYKTKRCKKIHKFSSNRVDMSNVYAVFYFLSQAAWELRAVSCIDLTTLAGDDTMANVNRLCFKAKNPVRQDLLKAMDVEDIGTG